MKKISSNFSLRPMRDEDLLLVWKWRNHPKVVATTISGPIPWEAHLDWFASLTPGEAFIFQEDGHPKGVVRLGTDSYWSFYIDPNLPPRQGYGRLMLCMALHLAKKMGLKKILGTVLKSNKASLKLHKEFGFRIIRRNSHAYVLRRLVATQDLKS